jgi:hypothetical protein
MKLFYILQVNNDIWLIHPYHNTLKDKIHIFFPYHSVHMKNLLTFWTLNHIDFIKGLNEMKILCFWLINIYTCLKVIQHSNLKRQPTRFF